MLLKTMHCIFFLLMFSVPLSAISALGGTNTPIDNFYLNCGKAWQNRPGSSGDVDYKNFGIDFCNCLKKQNPILVPIDINNSECLYQTILRQTTAHLENEVGLDKVSSEDIDEYCEEQIDVIFPNQETNNFTNYYCQCAKSKLLKLYHQIDNKSDFELDKNLKIISSFCFNIVKTAGETLANTIP